MVDNNAAGDLLAELWKLPEAAPFHETGFEGYPEYGQVPAQQNCLRNIGVKWDQKKYASPAEVKSQVKTVLTAAMNYFGGGRNNHIFQSAKKSWIFFENKWSAIEKSKLPQSMGGTKKRQLTLTGAPQAAKRKITSGGPPGSVDSMEEKELKGLEMLAEYIVDCGGEKGFLDGWYVTIEARKEGKTQGTSDMYYFSAANKKFRSRAEVARYFNLAAAPPKRAGIGSKKRRPTYELERRRIQKEIDKLNGNRSKIESKLGELIDEKEGKGKAVEDGELVKAGKATPQAKVEPDGVALPGIPDECMTDVLAIFDFLTMFRNSLAVSPCHLDDFAAALSATKELKKNHLDYETVPVFLTETHIAMLRLLVSDPTAELWWKAENVVMMPPEIVNDEGEVVPMEMEGGEEEEKKKSRRPPPFVVSNGDNGYNYEPLDEIRFPKIAREFPRSHWRVLRNNDGHYKIAHHLTPMNIYTSLSLARQYKEFLPEHERPPIDPMFDEEEDEEEEEKDQTIDALEKLRTPRSPVTMLLIHSKYITDYRNIVPLNFALYTGWVCEQVYQWYRMRRAFADGEVRKEYQLPRLENEEITKRARHAAFRLFPPCTDTASEEKMSPVESAIAHLLAGKRYMDLNVVQKVSLMRLLVEASYETRRITGVVEGNNLARVNAEKKLESDSKATSRAERERWSKIQVKAKEMLVEKGKAKFFRNIREKLAEESQKRLSNEQLLEDEQIKTLYDGIAKPSRNECLEKAKKMREAEWLEEKGEHDVVSLLQVGLVDQKYLDSMEKEGEALGIDGLDSADSVIYNSGYTRAQIAGFKELRKRRDEWRVLIKQLPAIREKAVQKLKDAAASESLKELKSAIKHAKDNHCVGKKVGGETEVTYYLESLRDAIVAQNNAEKRMKKQEGLKNLLLEKEKCFVRTASLGRDRDHRTFWSLSHDKPRVWVEELASPASDYDDAITNAIKCEEGDVAGSEAFVRFTTLDRKAPRSRWVCYSSEAKLRELLKGLDKRGKREGVLKANLRKLLESRGQGGGGEAEGDINVKIDSSDAGKLRGEEGKAGGDFDAGAVAEVAGSSSVGRRVRWSDSEGNFFNATVVGWREKMVVEGQPAEGGLEGGAVGGGGEVKTFWKIISDEGYEQEWGAGQILVGRLKHDRRFGNGGDVEANSPIWSYRNTLGRFSGKASEAYAAARPLAFAKAMVQKEKEMKRYLQNVAVACGRGNLWEGKNVEGPRGKWYKELHDAYELEEAGGGENLVTLEMCKRGLLTLEKYMYMLGGDTPDEATSTGCGQEKDRDLNGLAFNLNYEEQGYVLQCPHIWGFDNEARQVFIELTQGSDNVQILFALMEALGRNVRAFTNIDGRSVRKDEGVTAMVEDTEGAKTWND